MIVSDLQSRNVQLYAFFRFLFSFVKDISLVCFICLANDILVELLDDSAYVFARNGSPNYVVSDGGPQYMSEEFKRFALSFSCSGGGIFTFSGCSVALASAMFQVQYTFFLVRQSFVWSR